MADEWKKVMLEKATDPEHMTAFPGGSFKTYPERRQFIRNSTAKILSNGKTDDPSKVIWHADINLPAEKKK